MADRIRHSSSEAEDEVREVVATFGGEGPGDRRIQSAIEDHGHTLLGEFVTETAENGFPQLPVIQQPGLLVILSLRPAIEDRDPQPALAEHPEISEALELEPTGRSALGRRTLA